MANNLVAVEEGNYGKMNANLAIGVGGNNMTNPDAPVSFNVHPTKSRTLTKNRTQTQTKNRPEQQRNRRTPQNKNGAVSPVESRTRRRKTRKQRRFVKRR